MLKSITFSVIIFTEIWDIIAFFLGIFSIQRIFAIRVNLLKKKEIMH